MTDCFASIVRSPKEEVITFEIEQMPTIEDSEKEPRHNRHQYRERQSRILINLFHI
jgi:hypothetical protein